MDTQLTPMMKQYMELKKIREDTILFFRLGDFYEMFFDDARLAANILGITLTSRHKVPMAGVPYHAAESYICKLIKAGYKVAICEQVEDPKQAQGLIKRQIIRTITPGTVLAPSLLEDGLPNYLAAINRDNSGIGFSFVDVSTGEFKITKFSTEVELSLEFNRISPAESLIPASMKDTFTKIFGEENKTTCTVQDDWRFNNQLGNELLCKFFGVHSLDGFGCEGLEVGIGAAGAIIHYLKETQKNELRHIKSLRPYSNTTFMILDASTWRSLELTRTIRDNNKEWTLLRVLDKTETAMGARLLRKWLHQPLLNVLEICSRQEGVEALTKSKSMRTTLSQHLHTIADIERLISRLATGVANARDMVALKDSLKKVPHIKSALSFGQTSPILKKLITNMDELTDIVTLIEQTINDTPPISVSEGNLIKSGYDISLDELRHIRKDGKGWIAQLQRREIERTGINSLKVGYNKVFGYYIEVTNTNLSSVPSDYIRKQTLVNAERFITPELKDWEVKILTAEERIYDLEYIIFLKIREQVIAEVERIQETAEALSILDVLLSLARIAVENNYVRPQINDGNIISIHDGRHPVVEQVSNGFTPNDTFIDPSVDQILIITGPNMAGKSTYIRQVALICIMAQIGSFIPASKAIIGIVDRIFTRIGAADELVSGQSTFMMEMIEVANILNNATPNSLLILDEVGRGTSTFDGVSIAWAVVEYLHNTPTLKAKTLFATHYHELTELELTLPCVKNYNVMVKEYKDHVVFLHKIVKGATDKSYGIHVAKLAGLPDIVTNRAQEILNNFEMDDLISLPKKKPHVLHPKEIQGVEYIQLSLGEF